MGCYAVVDERGQAQLGDISEKVCSLGEILFYSLFNLSPTKEIRLLIEIQYSISPNVDQIRLDQIRSDYNP